ncbi:tRNA preQ1(34) S-adenosylmethionine ribosyltransferase-isomerase QueA [bacterium]|nr:tRNA preQ1(34) S-adenosylmethionine ribosyltransferase-isomerase QueA [bacterium]
MTTINRFNYTLPTTCIAQHPLKTRDASKLMVINLSNQSITHSTFNALPSFLLPTDVLVRNNTKVIPARLVAHKQTGAKLEVFLLKELSFNTWQVMIKPSKRIKEGDVLNCGTPLSLNVPILAEVIEKNIEGNTHSLTFKTSTPIQTVLSEIGKIPLPPYIEDKDFSKAKKYSDDYQNVFAKHDGAVAAPTAGRHFSKKLIKTLDTMGVGTEEITLHVGMGTFLPIKEDSINDHIMHKEAIDISTKTATQLTTAKKNGQRIIAVGTTVIRALESSYSNQVFKAASKNTSIFIKPEDTIHSCDGLITNFHLPKSTLMCLVAAMTGYDLLMTAYKIAIEKNYRFYSFGDAMLILP